MQGQFAVLHLHCCVKNVLCLEWNYTGISIDVFVNGACKQVMEC